MCMSNEVLKVLSDRIEYLEREISSIKTQIKSLYSDETKTEPVQSVGIIRPKANNIESNLKIPTVSKGFDLELLLGGNIIGKFGLIAILLAVGWFIKFAFDNQWINESGRIFIGFMIGFSVIIWGLFLAKGKVQIVPESLIGTGISILYISMYAAYYFYDLIGLKETFFFFALISFSTSLLSGKINSEILYIFGLIGSILAPVSLSSGENSYKFLFVYLSVINLLFLYISLKNPWKISPYILSLSNIVIYSIWSVSSLDKSNKFIALAYVTLFFSFLNYREIFIVPKLRKEIHISSLILIASLILVFISLVYQIIEKINPDLIGLVSLMIAFLILIAANQFEKNILEYLLSNQKALALRSLLLISIFSLLLFSLAIYLDGGVLSYALIFFATAITLAAIQLKNKTYLYTAILFWIFALLRLYFVQSYFSEHRFLILNSRFFLFILTSAILLYLYNLQKKEPISKLYLGFIYVSFFTLLLGSLIEVRYFISNIYYRNLAYSFTIGFYMSILLTLGFKHSFVSFRKAGIVLACILILKFYFYDIWIMSIIVRIIAGFSLGIGLIILSIFYQKYKDKINMEKILKLIVLFGFFISAINPEAIQAESFNENSYKYFSNLKSNKQISNQVAYGKIKISEEISKYHGMNDIRISYDGKLIPFFISKSIEINGKQGETKPKIIFDEVTKDGRSYVIKLENPPKRSEYFELEISAESYYESQVTVSLGETPSRWEETTTSTLFKYSGAEAESTSSKIQFIPGAYRYAKLSFNSKINFSFLAANYKGIVSNEEFKEIISIDKLNKSFDSDRSATTYYFENKEKKPISRIVLDFNEDKYDRTIEIYEKKKINKEFQIVGSSYIKRTNTKEPSSILITDYTGGEIKILIQDNDNAALTLKSLELYSQMYEIIFEIPSDFDLSKNLKLVYGNLYAYEPNFDIHSTYSQESVHANFTLEKHSENPNFTYSIMEPPISTWILRISFLIGFLGLMIPTYKILRKYKDDINLKVE
jgi:hypothetical protein